MYIKLALRSAARSINDHLLYMAATTMLAAILTGSNGLAVVGNVQAGLQTASLPLLIALILVLLTGYANSFLLRQRAKELATYLLMGMERRKLSRMFLIELLAIGLVCLVLGSLMGLGGVTAFEVLISHSPAGQTAWTSLWGDSLLKSVLYFGAAELLSGLSVKRHIDRLQIRELLALSAKGAVPALPQPGKRRRNAEGKPRHRLWGTIWAVSLLCYAGSLLGIAFLPDAAASLLISVIAFPLLLCQFAFYQGLSQWMDVKRRLPFPCLHPRDRLYLDAQAASSAGTGAVMNSVFCLCLTFSASSLIFGVFMLHPGMELFAPENRRWMGFLQIALCLIFMVLYFSVLSLQLMVETRSEARGLQLLHYLGKTQAQLAGILRKQTLLKWFLPTIMCVIPLMTAAPLVNRRLNAALPETMNSLLLQAIGGFALCYLALFLCYFLIVQALCQRYAETIVGRLKGL